MLLNSAVNFINNALGGTCTVNGMYVTYTAGPNTTIPTITASGGSTTSSLQDIISAFGQTPNAGICRVDNIAVDVNPSMTSGGSLVGSSGNVIATTANAHDVAGMPISAGCYVRGAITAHITESPADDIGFDYNVISGGGVCIPANGAVTIIDKVVIS